MKIFTLFCLILSSICVLNAQDKNTSEKYDIVIKYGYSVKVLMEIDPSDAEAALRILIQHIASLKGYHIKVETVFYTDIKAIKKDLQEKKLDVLAVLGGEFLELQKSVIMQPELVPTSQGSIYHKYILITHKNKAPNFFSTKKHNKLLVSVSKKNEFPFMWLDNIFAKKGLPQVNKVFENIEELDKPSMAVLPVFFSKADAAVVPLSLFNVVSELNPQLKKDLVILEESEDMLLSVICFTSNLPQKVQKIMKEAMIELKDTRQGKQILDIFNIEGMQTFDAGYLQGIRNLIDENNKRKNKKK
ncbi:MAG: hypothetical protein CVV23_14630 [Ignavibacteriae bacterium HGW-Ignavibacteriae-2]|nr:MAG: hypothetical protein CVV23_14630 [Ignavibacteriae bacterium HGW-Ignavibacteriae-2]